MRQEYGVLAILIAFTLCVTISCVACESEEEVITTVVVTRDLYPSPIGTRVVVPTVVDTGLAYGTPCKPPCWQGLTPGESTRQEASQVLNSLDGSSQVVHIIEGDDYFNAFSEASAPHGTSSAIGHFEENTLQVIKGYVEFYYSIGTLVESFGAPEGLTPFGGEGCSSCEEWEPPAPLDVVRMDSTMVQFLYPAQGLWFAVLASMRGCICPEMKVISFCYYTPMTMEEAFADNHLADLCSHRLGDFSQEDLVEWHGFGGGY